MKQLSRRAVVTVLLVLPMADSSWPAQTDRLGALASRLESDDLAEREEAVRLIGEFGSGAAPAVPAILCMLYVDVDTLRWFKHNFHFGGDCLLELSGSGLAGLNSGPTM